MTQTSRDKNYKALIKNMPDGFAERLDIVDKKIRKLKDIVIEII